MRTIHRSQFLAGSFGLGAALLGTGVGAQSTLAKLRVGTVGSDSFAGAYFAQDMRFFEKVDLAVDVQTFPNGSAVSSAIAGNALDIGAATPITLANAVAHDVPFVMIAPGGLSTAKDPNTLLVVTQNSPARSARDLIGKTVAVTGVRALADALLNVWLTKQGVDATKVLRVEMPGGPMAAALERGTVAAALINEPARSLALKSGNFRVLGDPTSAIAPQILSAAWFTTAAYAQQNADLVKRFQSAMATAQHWANSHHDESAAILATYVKGNVDVIRGMVRCEFADQLRETDIQPELDVAYKFGIISKPVKARDFAAKIS
jgi:NitT/TauT family transport system substrate-binding protein